MSLEQAAGEISGAVRGFIDQVFPKNFTPYLASPPKTDARYIDEIGKFKEDLYTTLSGFSAEGFSVKVTETASEETKTSIDAFNGSVGSQARDFILTMGFTKYSDSVLTEIRQKSLESDQISAEEITHDLHTNSIAKLAFLLDVTMALAADEKYASLKNAFYTLLQSIMEVLAAHSTSTLSTFWSFVESRAHVIYETVFDPKVTSNRIAILSLCNSLTDRLYARSESGKLDSYSKDSFSDDVQARIRVFLANLLNFDDSTGLNKYFSIAKREIREPVLAKVTSSDDRLLEDVMRFRKLLRDPYTYLKNPRQFAAEVDSLTKLHTYLLDAERKYSKLSPVPDPLHVKKPISEDQQKILSVKYTDAEFFPEQYWLSPFEAEKSGPEYEKVQNQDQKWASGLFDSSKFRKLLILQIYLVSCFFIELSQTRKKQLLKNTGALATTKHITEEDTPETLVPRFNRIKRETITQIHAWDPRWASALQNLQNSEENWWAWLIFGKSKDGSPLLADRTLSAEVLQETEGKFGSLFPEKTKRYFNTHATSQLSRKMKTATGLHLLTSKGSSDRNLEGEIADLAVKIENESDKATRAELIEERTILIWKQTRLLRDDKWLDLDGTLNAADLVNPDEKEEDEEKGGEEKENEKEDKAEVDGMEIDNIDGNVPLEGAKENPEENTNDPLTGSLNTPSIGESSIGEIAGDQVAEARVLQNEEKLEKSVGEAAGELVAETRKRERSPEGAVDEEQGGPETSKPRIEPEN